jgi:hypothetical protein
LFFMDETVRRTRHVAIVSSQVPDCCRAWGFKSPLRHKISAGHSAIRPEKGPFGHTLVTRRRVGMRRGVSGAVLEVILIGQ